MKHTPEEQKYYDHILADDKQAKIDRLEAVNQELVGALKGTLSWLSSYRGGGAINAYDRAQQAIAKATQQEGK